jgi:hypothetical protein
VLRIDLASGAWVMIVRNCLGHDCGK